MSWFDEQLHYRETSDDAEFAEAVDSITGAVMGRRPRDTFSSAEIAGSAIDEILKYYHCTPTDSELPPEVASGAEQLEYRMRPYGIRSRDVILEKGWYRSAVGAMLGTLREDGSAVALIPDRVSGYRFRSGETGKWVKLNSRTEQLLNREAVCFYQPLAQRALTVTDLLKFMADQLNVSDVVFYLVLMCCTALLGLLAPMFTKWLFGDVMNSGSLQMLLALSGFMICFTVSRLCFSSFQALVNARIGVKQNIAVQAAVMSRIMSLPPAFFRQYAAGELTQRANYVQSLCSTMFSTIGTTGIASLFSLIYVGQIFSFAPSLVVPSLLITVLTFAFSLVTTVCQVRITRQKMELSAKTSGMTYSAITGIQKIKLAGAEKRMFSRWAKQYSKEAELEYNPPLFLKLSGTISLAISLAGSLILYAVAIKSRVGVADYYAFNTAYAMVSSAFMSLASVAVTLANIRPSLEMAKPILEAEPEVQGGKEIITQLHGGIEMNSVSFRYDSSMPNVIDGLSLKVAPGEYLAVVGSTGCGKSTLMRLLLGFEKPQKGSITYDGYDIGRVDLESLRKKIGVVMQDGKLFLGDIYSNIVIAAPQLGLDEAWKAAEIASIADDIRSMPMGMHTVISEGQGGISGGQRQRLMIARAVAPSPKILMFDEATSALDNVTQKKVSEAIDSLKCTRIVIAHRLSTIRHADRIIFLEGGRIVEDGTYEELIAKNGYFADLVERQRLDIDVG